MLFLFQVVRTEFSLDLVLGLSVGLDMFRFMLGEDHEGECVLPTPQSFLDGWRIERFGVVGDIQVYKK